MPLLMLQLCRKSFVVSHAQNPAVCGQQAVALSASSTYDAMPLLQRVCTCVYDAFVFPYLAHTYATAATLVVVTAAHPRPDTPTTPKVPHRNGTRKQERKHPTNRLNTRNKASGRCHV